MLRLEGPLGDLVAALDGVERLVLLGDTLELRAGPVHGVLERARPALRRLAEGLDGRDVVIVPGNHDHALAAGWLERRAQPLGLEERCPPAAASTIAAALAEALAPSPVELRYPGLWLADGVYALHGHYLDVHMTVPTLERLAVAASGRLTLEGSRRWDDARSADDYEAVVAPLYAWVHAAAQTGRPSEAVAGGGTVRGWNALRGNGRGTFVRARALEGAFRVAVRSLNAAGLGPLRSELSMAELRRSGLRAASEVLARLGVRARHVIFGHTHRAGMLADDVGPEWLTPDGARLHNTGSWTFSRTFSQGPESPYWPGGAVVVEEGSEPRLLRLLARREAEELV